MDKVFVLLIDFFDFFWDDNCLMKEYIEMFYDCYEFFYY